jgi:hypothetical protein
VLSLLALLLVFISSITHQQASATKANHGFIGTVDHLVVASHNESIRVLGGNSENDAAVGGDPDLSDWWPASPMVLGVGLCRSNCIITAGAGHPPASPRFLIPLLRAPPLA